LRYLQLLERFFEAKSHTMIARNAMGKVTSVLPGFICEGPYGAVYNSLPFYGSHGSLLGDDPQNYLAWKSVLSRFWKEHEVAAATFVLPLAYESTHAKAWREVVGPTHFDERIGQITPLLNFIADEPEVFFTQFHQKTRNAVRKGYKNNVTFSNENNDDAWHYLAETHAQNIAALGGKPKPLHFFSLVRKVFRAGEDYRLFTASIDGARVAALLLFYYRDTVEYFTPVVDDSARSCQVLSALIHHAMRDAAKRDYRQWNWGGTWKSQEGVYRFKSRWGAKDHRYAYYSKIINAKLLQIDLSVLSSHYSYFYLYPYREKL
jgi:hypothetical protein